MMSVLYITQTFSILIKGVSVLLRRKLNQLAFQGPAHASLGRAAGACARATNPRTPLLQGENEDVRAGVWRVKHAQGQGTIHKTDCTP